MRKLVMSLALLPAVLLFAAGCDHKHGQQANAGPASSDARHRTSFRQDKNNWTFIHLTGTPAEIGFQHGWHLAPEIDDLLRTMSFYFERTKNRPWAFIRQAAERMFWPRLDQGLRLEMEGIAQGLQARRPELAYDRAWQLPYLRDMKANPWTVFQAIKVVQERSY